MLRLHTKAYTTHRVKSLHSIGLPLR